MQSRDSRKRSFFLRYNAKRNITDFDFFIVKFRQFRHFAISKKKIVIARITKLFNYANFRRFQFFREINISCNLSTAVLYFSDQILARKFVRSYWEGGLKKYFLHCDAIRSESSKTGTFNKPTTYEPHF